MKIFERSLREWHLNWSESAGVVAGTQVGATIRMLQSDAGARDAVRRLLSQRMPVGTLTDAQLYGLLGKMVQSGQLLLHWQASRLQAPKAKDEAKRPEEARGRKPAGVRGSIAEAAGFPPGHDMDAQSGALKNAAISGVPFCEECAKWRSEHPEQ